MIRDTSGQDVIIERTSASKRNRMLATAGVLGLIVAGLFAWPNYARWSSAEQSLSKERVRISTVRRGTLTRDIAAQGVVVAAVKPTLFSPVEGTASLMVHAGDSVSQGQALAIIDSPETLSLFKQESAALNSARTDFQRQQIEVKKKALENKRQVDLAKVDLVAAKRELRRAEAAHNQNAISEFDYDMARDNLEMAELKHQHAMADAELQAESLHFELETTRLNIDRQKLAVEELQRQVDRLSIRSPVTGIIGNLLVEDRDAVAKNQPLVTVVDLGAFEVELAVPDSYASTLHNGLEAEVSHQGVSYIATLASISPEVVNSQITARLRFSGAMPVNLRQNQRVSGRILLEGRDNVLLVDRGPFLESGGGRITYVVKDDLAVRTRFQSGMVSMSSVEVVSGLEEGDAVVISSLSDFDNATSVYLAD
jgi:HlyD family secretion protein